MQMITMTIMVEEQRQSAPHWGFPWFGKKQRSLRKLVGELVDDGSDQPFFIRNRVWSILGISTGRSRDRSDKGASLPLVKE